MRPPHCYVCGLDLHDVPDDGRDYLTIYFGPDDNAKMAPSRAMAGLGRAGHPRNAIWFRHQHAGLARQHEHLSTRDGLAAIDAATGRTPRTRRPLTQLPSPAPAHARSPSARSGVSGMFKSVQCNAGSDCHRVPAEDEWCQPLRLSTTVERRSNDHFHDHKDARSLL